MEMSTLKALTKNVVFSVIIDDSKSLSWLIEQGDFNSICNNVTLRKEYAEDHVWTPSKQQRRVNFNLLDGTEVNDWAQIELAAKWKGLRSANAKELLVFARRNPDLQRKIQVVALESRVLPGTNDRFIALLDGDEKRRDLTFHVFGIGGGRWPKSLFLAVEKEP